MRISPRRVNSFSSARSRTLQVLITITSASRSSVVDSKPACSRRPDMRSESWMFIWHPYVSIRYLRAMVSLSLSSLLRFRLGPGLHRRPSFGEHFFRAGDHRRRHIAATDHACEFLFACGPFDTRDVGHSATVANALFDA